MIALITGMNGFVGPYLESELVSKGYIVYGIDIRSDGKKIFSCDITDFDSVLSVIEKVRPDVIFHLAGFSSVSRSFQEPELCFKINVDGTKNLLDAVTKTGIKPKILVISSSEIYGIPKYIPIDESHPLNPISPYGHSRLAQERLCKEYDLPIIISRSFNHTGPGQQETFVIPSFIKQIENIKDKGIIYVGDLDITRDFSDVRDIVKAYIILIAKGIAGEAYNVGSGIPYNLRDILHTLIERSHKNINIKVDPERFRPNDIKEIVCDNTKLLKLEKIKFRNILNDIQGNTA
ncbi:MAG: GDP-mannose 4,6-dehydratase [Candidatus Woesearchaeota archaeon]